MTNEHIVTRPPRGITALVLVSALVLGSGCASGFQQAVAQWAKGPSYSAPAKALAGDAELDETSKRIELMGYAGLACTIDENDGNSKPENSSLACKCAKPTNEITALSDCISWAQGL